MIENTMGTVLVVGFLLSVCGVCGENPMKPQQFHQNDKMSFSSASRVAGELFEASLNNSYMMLTDLSRCVSDYNLLTCAKLLLLSRVNNLVAMMEVKNTTGADLNLFSGIVTLKWLNSNDTQTELTTSGGSTLDKELTSRMLKLFSSRSLQLSLLPGFGLEITPKVKPDDDGFVCFSAKTFVQPNFNKTVAIAEMRKKMDGGKKKKKGGGFNMMPMMIVPQMIMLGMLPFALANLKMMVMNAFMLNSMALNSAIFMTVRNLVFGPKHGPKVKYVNYGYNKKKPSKKPELVLHSPAAFVRPTPPRHEELHHSQGPYLRRTNNKRRKSEFQSSVRNDRYRLKTGLNGGKKEVENVPGSYDEIDSGNWPESENSVGYYDPGTVEQSGVDAPSSYLNNNQFLVPGAPNSANDNIHLSYDSTAEDANQNRFSSKYNSNSEDSYWNHRLSS